MTDQVFVVEGEKDADALAQMGLVATCNSGGAGKWLNDFKEHFAGKRVVVLPDNDQAGRSHARTVARSLSAVAGQIKIVELPGLEPKGDVSGANGGKIERFDMPKRPP